MPRITRAALRSHALLEDADLAASTPLPLTPRTRVPLGEIAGNKEEVAAVVIEPLELFKIEKEPPAKGKRGRIAKSAKKQENCKTEDSIVEVLEDAIRSPISSAVDDACQDLMQPSTGGKYSPSTRGNGAANRGYNYQRFTKLSCTIKDRTHRPHAPLML